ncbi:MAG: hypothetical protein O9333_02475 [Beijerinckiaceae bacterium]|jgi:hypothetical protein|nr:hypothetical protein [Beijerinckiaceae bacterium]
MVTWFQKVILFILGFVWCLLALAGLLGFPVVSVLPVWMIVAVVIAGLVVGLVPFVFWWLIRRNSPAYGARRSFLAFALAGILSAMGLAAFPVYYFAYWVDAGPSHMPLATLSNGKKTVVFQGMQHVGSEDFYKSVVFDLEKALADGYTLFYEGVQPVADRPDLNEWFNKTLRGTEKDLSAGYQQLADACSMKFQLTYFEPLLADKTVNPKRHVTADVTYLDMKNEYDRLLKDDPSFVEALRNANARKAASSEDNDPLMRIIANVGAATPEQKNLIGILCRGIMSQVISGAASADPIERIILDFRNRALARFIQDSEATKIYITYGAKHFTGVVADLKTLDPAWTVQSIQWGRAMSNPRAPSPPSWDWQAMLRPSAAK